MWSGLSLWLAFVPVAPAVPEVCNSADDDGDGFIDEGPVASYPDLDLDGSGDRSALLWSVGCTGLPPEQISDGNDCDDTDDSVIPNAGELANTNGIDDDCDDVIDEGASPNNAACDFSFDDDSTFLACDVARVWSVASNQCALQGYHLATIDDEAENDLLYVPLNSALSSQWIWWWFGLYESANIWYWESGASSYENWAFDQPNQPGSTCAFLYEYDGEWYDWNCNVGYPYLCEADCVYRSAYLDSDGDGFGDEADALLVCTLPADRVWNKADCDDSDDTVGTRLWYEDLDEDGYGTVAIGVGCEALPSSSALLGDCDDTNAERNPEEREVCDIAQIDEDCDGMSDDEDDDVALASTLRWYPDDDGDSYGSGEEVRACLPPPGYAAVDSDCDDTNSAIHPDADEQCNGRSEDCDTEIDEGLAVQVWYEDKDGDTAGDAAFPSSPSCGPPDGYVASSDDCDDGDPSRFPNNPEISGDGVDQDCDGIDPAVGTDTTTDTIGTDAAVSDTADTEDPLPRAPVDETLKASAVGCGCAHGGTPLPLWSALAVLAALGWRRTR